MLKKIIQKLKSPHVWYCTGMTVVAVAGVILASTLYQSDEERPPAIYYGQEEHIVTADPALTIPVGEEDPWPSGETQELTPPVTSESEATDPTVSVPVSTAPTDTKSEATDATVSEPVSTDPTDTEPEATDPMTTDPQPDVTQPAPTSPTETEPQVTAPTVPIDPQKPDQTVNPGIPPETEMPQMTAPQKQELTVEQIAAFSGAYVEDYSDEPVQNVASVLVTNETENFLDLGTLSYEIDGKEATFIVTGLPAGASAWVMEASRLTVTNDSEFKQKGCTTSFRQDAVTAIKDAAIQSSGNMLKVENNSDETLKNVAVYYKAIHTDGNYFGGITYMTVLGDVAPRESAEKFAGHFREGWTDVVRVSYQISRPST